LVKLSGEVVGEAFLLLLVVQRQVLLLLLQLLDFLRIGEEERLY
jgi:hypothetical protein